jgi:hypothetical protein
MNDLARMRCSEEVVVMGILRVVEEILEKKPNAHIVLNSLFPLSDLRGGIYPVLSDLEDSIELTSRMQRRDRLLMKFRNILSRSSDEYLEDSGSLQSSVDENSLPRDEVEVTAEREELARDAEARKRRRKKRRNNVLKDKKAVKKYKMGHVRKNTLPLWTSVRAINNELQKFAEKQERVHYFDATDVFVTRDIWRRLIIRSDRVTPEGHPTLEGFGVLEEKMTEFLAPILLDTFIKRPYKSPLFTSSQIGENSKENTEDEWGNIDYSKYFKSFFVDDASALDNEVILPNDFLTDSDSTSNDQSPDDNNSGDDWIQYLIDDDLSDDSAEMLKNELIQFLGDDDSFDEGTDIW